MKKIVVLNSGGFDSTVLMNYVYRNEEPCEIHSLYFNYGQLNGDLCQAIAETNARKLLAVHHNVKLPEFSWTNSDFFKSGVNDIATQYLEMRNMIFISYAMSLAESIGATSIFMAILSNGSYNDTKKEFVDAVRNLCSTIDISFETPFITMAKPDLFFLAKKYGVGTRFEFLSCDTPENGKPCGWCADCQSLVEYDRILSDPLPIMRFATSGFDTHDQRFQELLRNTKPHELRVNLNNDCQLNCKHCYHNNNPLVSPKLSDEELISAIRSAVNYGIDSIHFCGKEPLYDDRVFRITKAVKDEFPQVRVSLVTNGINVPLYINDIMNAGFETVFLSVGDEFADNTGSARPNSVNRVIKSAVELLTLSEVPVHLFYDLTPDNISNTIRNIKYWSSNFGVKYFDVRTIRLTGCAEDSEKLRLEDIYKLHQELITELYGDEVVILNIGACPYTYDILFDDSEDSFPLRFLIDYCASMGDNRVTNNYILYAEMYCNRYFGQVTLTADGYVLGCAMECSVREYNKTSPGNVRENDFCDLVRKGIEQSIAVNESQSNKNTVYFEKCSFNPIDI